MMTPRVWPVFVVYLLAIVAVVGFSAVAELTVRHVYADLTPGDTSLGLP